MAIIFSNLRYYKRVTNFIYKLNLNLKLENMVLKTYLLLYSTAVYLKYTFR